MWTILGLHEDGRRTTFHVRTLVFVLLAATMGLGLFVPTASAQGATCTDFLENRTGPSNASSAPGGLLADAIGDQRDEIGSELGDTWLDARLENATSTRSRARVVSEAVNRIETNVSTLERCLGIDRPRRTADRSQAELDADERPAVANYTRSLHRRLNATRAEADRLPDAVRDEYDVDAETLTSLERRVVALRNATDREATASTTGGPYPFQ